MRATYQHRDNLDQAELQRLLTEQPGPCVSIFMPILYAGGPEIQTEPLRLKQLLEEAEEQLLAIGLPPSQVHLLLAPAHPYVVNEQQFWQQQNAGLAVFLAADTFLIYRLPITFDMQVIVGNHFYIRPLLPLLTGDGVFYLLALSQNKVRLFKGARDTMEELKLTGMPHSLAEARQFDQVQPMRQVHSIEAGGIGGRHTTPVYTGQGTAADEKLVKKAIEHYLRQVDQGVQQHLAGQTAPLVVAGVDVLRGLYGEVTHYRHLANVHIDGNPDRLSATELHERTWSLIAPQFQGPRRRAVELYHQLAGQEDTRAGHTLRLILLDAYEKRIESLFVKAGVQQWGTVDAATLTMETHSQPQVGDEDLINVAVVYTLRNRGAVYQFAASEMPDNAPVAAVLRY
ncbi:MAG: hypothetical protein U0350_14035 [Caldilineaceae bacterium]